MDDYFKLEIKDYDNLDEIIKLNDKINKLRKMISKNKNLTVEINNNFDYLNTDLNTDLNSKFKKKKS